MAETDREDLERMLEAEFPNENPRFTSTAEPPKRDESVLAMVRPRDQRGLVPLTLESFVVSENPARVEWERLTREFLGQLSQDQAHRVTASMVFEWVTGKSIKELAKSEGVPEDAWRGGAASGSANMHLRHINAILKEYFGTPHKTTIAGRAVGRAYAVRKYFRIKLKEPMSMTLKPDWKAGTLEY
ncbi:hypothetical protein SEA_YELLOWPANDA_1 [Microbacterium phage YellowPanda]|uniref:Uncharacterized protein n=2 Tax=Tinytimothyvirus tinytimothy TaxID=2845596 RepID=A0A5Q2WJH6_9CAUD|nr:hypothetical protein HWC33_gp01 [Microbacterium phage TinyTimothy]QDF16954.1 hypothetical protein SEA_TINYTIMOTHY_1 [Microbacterium phage TinyTimothy]QGH78642.1 hypothetical protein SEA_WESAK_1 [Microbacterium phage Wesak]